MHTSVLVIDDEPELAEYTAKYFNMSGVDTRFVLSRQEALDFLGENTCSLVLLDINLGGDSGFDLCREIRSTTDVPIFFISARSSEDAKVKAVLKRYEEKGGSTSDEGLIQLGSSCFDMKKAAVIRDGVSTGLKAMEYKLLVYMLKNRGRVIPKDEFFEKVWETDYVSDVTLNVVRRFIWSATLCCSLGRERMNSSFNVCPIGRKVYCSCIFSSTMTGSALP